LKTDRRFFLIEQKEEYLMDFVKHSGGASFRSKGLLGMRPAPVDFGAMSKGEAGLLSA
jgi:hypothetical protein